MNRSVFSLLLTFVGTVRAMGQPYPLPPLQIANSRPVTVNGARFELVAQTQWEPAKPRNDLERWLKYDAAPIDSQLRVTNVSGSTMRFAPNTFRLVILKKDGTELGSVNLLHPPFQLPRDVSWTIPCIAELRFDEGRKVSDLAILNEKNDWSTIGPMPPGRYKILASASTNGSPCQSSAPKTWTGKLTTGAVDFEVLNEIPDGGPRYGQAPKIHNELIEIHESSPKVVNRASFVAAAQTNWMLSKQARPLEFQLRITNLAKTDVVFATFDAFRMDIKRKDGEWICPRGGRNTPFYTPPIQIGPGGTYAITTGTFARRRRSAELRWSDREQNHELIFENGTLAAHYFAPISAGVYSFKFRYGFEGHPEIAKKLEPGEPLHWEGSLGGTHNVSVQVSDE